MNCLYCKKEVLKNGEIFSDGSVALEFGEADKILNDGNTSFVICNNCGAKNILENYINGNNSGKYYIARFEK